MELAEKGDLVAPWNDQLVNLAHQIHQARKEYIERINKVLERQFFDRRDITTDMFRRLKVREI